MVGTPLHHRSLIIPCWVAHHTLLNCPFRNLTLHHNHHLNLFRAGLVKSIKMMIMMTSKIQFNPRKCGLTTNGHEFARINTGDSCSTDRRASVHQTVAWNPLRPLRFRHHGFVSILVHSWFPSAWFRLRAEAEDFVSLTLSFFIISITSTERAAGEWL